MHDRRNSGKSMLLSVIGITVIMIGLFLIVSPVFIPSLATGANPPNIYWSSIQNQANYGSINSISVQCKIYPAAGSSIQSAVFRYAVSTLTPTQANDPSNNWANARTLQWTNVSLVHKATYINAILTSNDPWIVDNAIGGIYVQSGYYYYYLFNAYSFDGSSNYYPEVGGSIMNNWFSVGLTQTSTPTPTQTQTPAPTSAPTYYVTFTVSDAGGTIQWADSTSYAQGGSGTFGFALNDALSVTAVPASGYQFDHFYIAGSLSGSTTNNPFQTGVVSGFTLTAYFVPIGLNPTPTPTFNTPTPTFNPNPTPTPTPSKSPTPSPTYNPNVTPTPTSGTYNPFASPTPAPYTTVRSWAIVGVGIALALCGSLLVAVGQTGGSRRKR